MIKTEACNVCPQMPIFQAWHTALTVPCLLKTYSNNKKCCCVTNISFQLPKTSSHLQT